MSTAEHCFLTRANAGHTNMHMSIPKKRHHLACSRLPTPTQPNTTTKHHNIPHSRSALNATQHSVVKAMCKRKAEQTNKEQALRKNPRSHPKKKPRRHAGKLKPQQTPEATQPLQGSTRVPDNGCLHAVITSAPACSSSNPGCMSQQAALPHHRQSDMHAWQHTNQTGPVDTAHSGEAPSTASANQHP